MIEVLRVRGNKGIHKKRKEDGREKVVLHSTRSGRKMKEGGKGRVSA